MVAWQLTFSKARFNCLLLAQLLAIISQEAEKLFRCNDFFTCLLLAYEYINLLFLFRIRFSPFMAPTESPASTWPRRVLYRCVVSCGR